LTLLKQNLREHKVIPRLTGPKTVNINLISGQASVRDVKARVMHLLLDDEAMSG
jgi:hypothetical protein